MTTHKSTTPEFTFNPVELDGGQQIQQGAIKRVHAHIERVASLEGVPVMRELDTIQSARNHLSRRIVEGCLLLEVFRNEESHGAMLLAHQYPVDDARIRPVIVQQATRIIGGLQRRFLTPPGPTGIRVALEAVHSHPPAERAGLYRALLRNRATQTLNEPYNRLIVDDLTGIPGTNPLEGVQELGRETGEGIVILNNQPRPFRRLEIALPTKNP